MGAPGGQLNPPGSTPPGKPAPKPATPTQLSPIQWAQQVLADVGAPVTANTTQDILAWMVNEEPASTWWGGYGPANAPSRINPLNAGDIGHYGYHATPLTGNTLTGGLGTYNTLEDAAAASAQMIHQGNMSGILQALMGNANLGQFTQAVETSPWASGHYGGVPWTMSQAQAEAGGPIVTGGIGSQVGPVAQTTGGAGGSGGAGEVAAAAGSQITPETIAQIIQDALLQQQVPLSQANFQDQLNFLGQNYNYTQQQFGLQQAQLGLQRQSLGQQTSHLQAGYGFQQQQDVLTGKSIQATIDQIKKQFGISMGQLGLQQTQARQGLAASGVFNTGTKTQEEQSFGMQRAAATASEQYELFQQQQAQSGLKLTEAEQKEQFGYSFNQLLNGQHQLDIQYQQLGISKAQARTQYENAVQQLGLGNLMNGIQLEQQMAALAGGGYSPIGQFMQQLTTLLPFTAGAFTSPGTGGF